MSSEEHKYVLQQVHGLLAAPQPSFSSIHTATDDEDHEAAHSLLELRYSTGCGPTTDFEDGDRTGRLNANVCATALLFVLLTCPTHTWTCRPYFVLPALCVQHTHMHAIVCATMCTSYTVRQHTHACKRA
eukprot:m.237523 g.237523  ORF g.237523 m.237523 type:complete len:130 (-) comp15271_c0_seq2:600-989(-)